MKNFEFSKKEFNLIIIGHKFNINDNENTSKNLIAFGEKMKKKSSTIKESDNYNLIAKECCNDCYIFIDEILGKGAASKIFTGRDADIWDCIELINFLTEEIKLQREARLNKYSNSRIERNQNFKKRR